MSSGPGVRLKALLTERHWQTYRTFQAEYDRAARRIDPALAGQWPSRAQLHRWLSGGLMTQPYPDHCRVLEEMFPGWTAKDLFALTNGNTAAGSAAPSRAVGEARELAATDEAMTLQMFADLNEEDNRLIAQRLRRANCIIFVAHTGYNAMVSQYQSAIRDAVRRGCTLRVVVTDPTGPLMKEPVLTTRLCPSIRQEGEIQDVLSACARHLNEAVKHGHTPDNVQARLYLGPPSMNALRADNWLRIIPYLPLLDAADSPVFEYEFGDNTPSGCSPSIYCRWIACGMTPRRLICLPSLCEVTAYLKGADQLRL